MDYSASSGRKKDAGYITRVTMKNFLHYTDVTVEPGNKLNLIVGRNGAGKSTIVNAICLGLAGPPSILGRGDNVVDFIKRDQDTALIRIALKNENGGETIFERTIKKSGHSEWKINDKKSDERSVKQLVKEMRIQLANLCHFLPQNRVQDFSLLASKPHELLLEVERAVGFHGMVDMHEELIKLGKEQAAATTDLNARITSSNEMKKELERLKVELERFQRRKELKEKIDIAQKKRLWAVANEESQRSDRKKVELAAAKEREEEAMTRYKQINDPLIELEKEKTAKEKENGEMLNAAKALGQQYETLHNEMLAHIEEEKMHETRYNAAKNSLANIEKEIQSLQRQRDEKRKQASKADALGELRDSMQKISKVSAQLEEKRDNLQSSLAVADEEIRRGNLKLTQIDKTLAGLSDLRQLKIEVMRKTESELIECYMMIQSNQHRFREKVWGPMILDVNAKVPEYGGIIESAIAAEKGRAFIVSSRADYNSLLQLVDEKLPSFSPQISVLEINPNIEFPENLAKNPAVRDLKISAWMLDVIDAPRPVLLALQSFCNIGQHYIGQPDANDNTVFARHNPSQWLGIRSFFQKRGNDFVHHFRREKAGDTLITSRFIRPAKILAPQGGGRGGVVHDMEKEKGRLMEERKIAERQVKEAQVRMNEMNKEMAGIAKEMEKVNNDKRHASEAVRAVNNSLGELKRIEARLKAVEENRGGNFQREMERSKEEIGTRRKKQLALVEKIAAVNRKRITAEAMLATVVFVTESVRSKYRALLSQVETLKTECEDLHRQTALINDEFQQLRASYKAAMDKAKRLAPLDEKLQALFEELPRQLAEIDQLISDMSVEMESIRDNSDKVDRFERLSKEFDVLTGAIGVQAEAVRKRAGVILEKKNVWLPALRQLVTDIDEVFVQTLRQQNVVGSVVLEEPEGDDFSSYGLRILVKFRAEAELMPLGKQHSGGENSTTTMVFLIALQRLSDSPFRVVDEINQGMDLLNEKMVFMRIVEHCCAPDACQTFLITPKLQSNLLAGVAENVTALCVHSGMEMANDKEWNEEKFFASARKRMRLA